MGNLPRKYLVIIVIFVLAAVAEVAVAFALKNNGVKLPLTTLSQPTPIPQSSSSNLPYDAQDPALIQASAVYVFQGTIINIDRDKDNNLLISIRKTPNGAPNLTPLKIPANTKVSTMAKGSNIPSSVSSQMDASTLKVSDNVVITFNYDLKTKQVSVLQLSIVR